LVFHLPTNQKAGSIHPIRLMCYNSLQRTCSNQALLGGWAVVRSAVNFS
jgi:hypothetical protein